MYVTNKGLSPFLLVAVFGLRSDTFRFQKILDRLYLKIINVDPVLYRASKVLKALNV